MCLYCELTWYPSNLMWIPDFVLTGGSIATVGPRIPSSRSPRIQPTPHLRQKACLSDSRMTSKMAGARDKKLEGESK